MRALWYLDRDQQRHAGTVSVHAPLAASDGVWRCTLAIAIDAVVDEIDNDGGDAVQALELALRFLPALYQRFTLRHGITLQEAAYDP